MPWEQLINIYREAREIAAEERSRRPEACPNDGEPLKTGPDTKLYCPWGDWKEGD